MRIWNLDHHLNDQLFIKSISCRSTIEQEMKVKRTMEQLKLEVGSCCQKFYSNTLSCFCLLCTFCELIQTAYKSKQMKHLEMCQTIISYPSSFNIIVLREPPSCRQRQCHISAVCVSACVCMRLSSVRVHLCVCLRAVNAD